MSNAIPPSKHQALKEDDPNFDPIVDIIKDDLVFPAPSEEDEAEGTAATEDEADLDDDEQDSPQAQSQRRQQQEEWRPYIGIDFSAEQARSSVTTFENALRAVVREHVDFALLPLTRDDADAMALLSAPKSNLRLPKLMDRTTGGTNPLMSEPKLLLKTSDWSNRAVGVVDEQFVRGLAPQEADASQNGSFSKEQLLCEASIRQELEWASHLALPAVVVPLPAEIDVARAALPQIARILTQTFNRRMHFSAVWIKIPLFIAYDYTQFADEVLAGEEGAELKQQMQASLQRATEIKKLWIELKTLCHHHRLLGVILELQQDSLGEEICDEAQAETRAAHTFEQWFAEPLRAIITPFSTFKLNRINYPVLASRVHEALFTQCFVRDKANNIQIVLRADGTGAKSSSYALYRDFLIYVYNEAVSGHYEEYSSNVEAFERPYLDHLQMPLQPLMDNLDSQTYEIFERDPIKYQLYEEATRRAIDDIVSGYYDVDSTENNSDVISIMVVGAGRGPLVKAALRAIRKSTLEKRAAEAVAGAKPPLQVMIYALEKNPNALVILRHFKKTIWAQDNQQFQRYYGHLVQGIELIDGDMRSSQHHKNLRCDIMISELLGSFGDNELSPECLDGARELLKSRAAFEDDRDGLSIPYSYTSYLAPLSNSKIFNEIKAFNASGALANPDAPPVESMRPYETAYVVKSHRGMLLDEPKPVFTFTHKPFESKDELSDERDPENLVQQHRNDRYISLRFESRATAELHGLIGYFDCTLYQSPKNPEDKVLMSIHPDTHSPGMFSWFPLVFPIGIRPVPVDESASITVNMWRLHDSHKVWYEWTLVEPRSLPICNVLGRSYFMMK